MSKIKITTALERQIPEFIREDYTTFVKFVKAYYEFLAQSGDRNLEDLRSIDRTLDEFVVKFKKELAAIFPTGTLPNERVFLEHIADFYNTRGSVESYQLLFRILFNKDAEIFYPSTQILKMSDGKWVQEKSVFVKSTDNLFGLKGKIIKIQTAKKHLDVFCPNVILYRDDIYEVFLDKQYYNDISIGDIVSYNGFSGYILPCPAKYKVVKEGKGFEIGSIYNLPTASGNGSVIKVTRIGSLGEIKAIQVISFGLDYQTNFYAQLSNKTTQALVYYHPITQYIAGFPRDELLDPTSTYGYPDENPASQEQVSDYVNYGYFSTQNYFYYDPSYVAVEYNPLTSVEQSDMMQTVWFADTTYVGEIIASFYTNEAGLVIDEDSAEIKIELGPVAAYPGYYASNDGFISDESYLHDGDYYQLFSYVVKVEEKLEDYKEIVKTLLQPAGLKLFGEYNIYKNFDVVATPLLAFIRRQLFDQIYQFGDYQEKELQKVLTDILDKHQEVVYKDLTKPFTDASSLEELNVLKNVSKLVTFEDNYAELIDNDISSKYVTKPLIEVISLLVEQVEKSLDRINEDYISAITELVAKSVSKEIDPELISDILDNSVNLIGLNKQEITELFEEALISINYGYIENINLVELIQKSTAKSYTEDILIQDIFDFQRQLNFIETYTVEEAYAALANYIRSQVETLTVSQTNESEIGKNPSEIISSYIENFILSINFTRSFEDTINNIIEGNTLLYNPFSAATITGVAADRFFAEEYAVITTIDIT